MFFNVFLFCLKGYSETLNLTENPPDLLKMQKQVQNEKLDL